ncbi:MAG: prolyl oligopeptidase family serine peptidase [Planctomycetes bacterium]|nr:prolyl oligopeptidase family serine peptidase [Planctomycetota bacterium]
MASVHPLNGLAAESDRTPQYTDHQDLSYYMRSDGSRAEIRTADDWQVRRRHILAGMEQAMGPLPRPAKPVPLDVQILEEHNDNGIIRRKLAYHTDRPDQQVKAWLLMPAGRGLPHFAESAEQNVSVPLSAAKRRPAVLCLHQTTPGGKDSPIGLADRPTLHYALELARRGYVTLSPDYPSFGEYEYDFDADDYKSGSMKAIYDNMRAIDLLQSLSEVDDQLIGCIGHSLGGHNALFTAAFDERIKAVVTSCGFTSFHKYMGGDLHGWSGPRYMPRVATDYNFSPNRMPFDFHEVLASIAPRGIFIVAPLHDDNFDVAGVRDSVKAARPIYKLFGHPDRLQVTYPDAGHDFPDDAREEAYAFFDQFLNMLQ